MLTVICKVDAPAGHAIGVKEQIAMELEKIGDVCVVEVRVDEPKQMNLGGKWK